MKILLIVSVFLNFFFLTLLLKKSNEVPLEKTIIETHVEQRPLPSSDGPPKPANKPRQDKKKASLTPFHEEEFLAIHERLESERNDFMITELGLTPEKLVRYQELKEAFALKSSELWKRGNSYGEMSFAERRRLIDLEEQLHRDLSALMGKKQWNRYQKFRDNYNRKGFKRQSEENQPFLFMGL
jgi:hypothetical protein